MTAVRGPRKRKRSVNFARLNHILIPRRSGDRDRFRRGLTGVLLFPFRVVHGAFTREGRALIGISILVGVAGLDVGNSQVYLLWAALSGLLLGSVLARPLYGMRAAKLRVIAPRRATAYEPVSFEIEVDSDTALQAVRIETPFLPWDGRWLDHPRGIASVRPAETGRSRVTARFVERGEHHLDPFSARAMVPFGLAAGSAVFSATCRFLVLPRMANVGTFELVEGGAGERRRVASHILGPTGDLAGVRPYRPGDPIRHLHARTWARVGSPHVREHVRERNQRAALVLILDQMSDEKVAEAAISLAAGVASAVAHGSGGLGLVALDGDVELAHPGGAPGVVVDSTLDRLAVYRVPVKTDAAGTAFAITSRMSDVSSVVVVTADRDETPGEPTSEAAAIVEDLRREGLGVRLVIVVDGDVVPERGLETARIGRGAIESGVEIRI